MIETPFNYTGSKFKLLEQLLPYFDYTKSHFVDLFAGGGSVYTNVADRYDNIIVNDVIKDLVDIHQSLLDSDDIIAETKSICPPKGNPELFRSLREDYNSNPTPSKLWALMLSCNSNLIRFNQRGKFNQTYGERSWNTNTDKKVKLFTEHIRKYNGKFIFTSEPFYKIPILTNKTMVYCDPPYGYVKDGNGLIGNKQISEAGYNNFYYKSLYS